MTMAEESATEVSMWVASDTMPGMMEWLPVDPMLNSGMTVPVLKTKTEKRSVNPSRQGRQRMRQ